MSAMRLIVYDRLTTPPEHLDILLVPTSDAIHDQVNSPRHTAYDRVAILDTTLADLRDGFRREAGLRPPLILTGHQSEFYHAGVFAKLIAAEQFAAQLGGSAAYLAVDSDLPKSTDLIVPRIEGGIVRQTRLPIPGCDPRLPAESQPRLSKAEWQDFFDSIRERIPIPENALSDYRDGILANTESRVSLRDVTLDGQQAVLRSLGLPAPAVLTVSKLTQTPEFRALLAHLVLNARRFVDDYNAAQRAYRQDHRVRNTQRPAPLLYSDGDRVELPFWIFRLGEPRRRLFVSAADDRVRFFADREHVGEETAGRMKSLAGHQTPWTIEEAGWGIRPRGLMLSAWMRLLFVDLFIHGIGGAKYDEMTEEFVRRFFGVELMPMCCVSATARLPLPIHGRTREEVRDAVRAVRDLRFNPQRYNPNLSAESLRRRDRLIQESRRLGESRPPDRAARRSTYEQIHRINEELLGQSSEIGLELENRYRIRSKEMQSDRSARDREYFFALHSRETLFALTDSVRAKLRGE